jgi:hypothetical protein
MKPLDGYSNALCILLGIIVCQRLLWLLPLQVKHGIHLKDVLQHVMEQCCVLSLQHPYSNFGQFRVAQMFELWEVTNVFNREWYIEFKWVSKQLEVSIRGGHTLVILNWWRLVPKLQPGRSIGRDGAYLDCRWEFLPSYSWTCMPCKPLGGPIYRFVTILLYCCTGWTDLWCNLTLICRVYHLAMGWQRSGAW